MGTYSYILTTKSRRVKVDGVSQDFYLMKFHGKVSSSRWDKPRRGEQALLARLDNAWARRDSWPKYAVHEGFGNGYPVYEDIDTTYFEEGYLESRHIAGYMTEINGKLVFEKWHRITFDVPFEPLSRITVAQTLIDSGLIGGPSLVHKKHKPNDSRMRELITVSVRDYDDLVRAKLVLSDLQEYDLSEA